MSDTNGWTTVPRGKRSSKSTHAKTPGLNGTDRAITVEHLQRDFEKKIRLWRGSPGRKTLLQMLTKNAPDEGWKFDKAVCLATGSFSTQNLELNRRGMLQLACFMDLATEMGKARCGGDGEMEVLAQEPKYSPLDRAFLSTLSISVLATEPGVSSLGPAKSHLGPSTLLCDFFMNMSPQAEREFFAAPPGLYVGTPFVGKTAVREGIEEGEEEGLRVVREKFEKRYVRRNFPISWEGSVDPGVFEGLSIWWPDPGEEEKDE